MLTTPSAPSTSPNFFGASVSGRLQGTQPTRSIWTIEADFIIGSPGYDVTQNAARNLAGGAQIVEAASSPSRFRPPTTVTTQIGVGTPFAPFSINATTPANLQIFVFGSTTTTPNFMPVTDIDPATVEVNGVAFPNATLVQDPNTANYLNGIPDAIITISPRVGTQPGHRHGHITITGKTLATSPLPNLTWTGTATRDRHRRLGDTGRRRRRRRPDRPGPRDHVRLDLRGQSVHAVAHRTLGPQLPADPALRRPPAVSAAARASASGSTRSTTPARPSDRT